MVYETKRRKSGGGGADARSGQRGRLDGARCESIHLRPTDYEPLRAAGSDLNCAVCFTERLGRRAVFKGICAGARKGERLVDEVAAAVFECDDAAGNLVCRRQSDSSCVCCGIRQDKACNSRDRHPFSRCVFKLGHVHEDDAAIAAITR